MPSSSDNVGPLGSASSPVNKSSTSIAEEADLGDIPENYLDPLLDELMRDPVKLPASGVIVDRSTITGHLLSNETDPFNREKLTLDMVVPEPALKAEIEAWVAAKRKEAAGANAQ